MSVKTAIIPVAGMGTRMLPATKAQPKEMITVVDKPVIQYIVEEAVDAGIENIVFVTAIGKRAIEDHFDRNFELEYRLEQKRKHQELKEIAEIGKLAKFSFVRQHKPLGDGHAVLTAVPFIDRHEPVAVLFGDDIIDAKKPGIKQLIDVYNRYGDPVVMVTALPKKEVSKYGVIGGIALDDNTWEIKKFVEKPAPEKAPSNLAVIGRYILTPDFIDEQLINAKPGKDGEIRLANGFVDRLKAKKPVYAGILKGAWRQCGDKLNIIKTSVELGLKDPDIKKDLKKYLKSL
jgi:UTP--glucose-1-phosphate uridylyltransferase